MPRYTVVACVVIPVFVTVNASDREDAVGQVDSMPKAALLDDQDTDNVVVEIDGVYDDTFKEIA